MTAVRVNPVLSDLGSYAIAELQEKARQLRSGGEAVIDFSIGDPIEPTPEFIREAVAAAIPQVSRYPTVPGLSELRGAVAGYVARRLGIELDADSQVLPTSGSKEAIFSTAMAFCGPADLVVWPSPGYPIYERGARLTGSETHIVRLADDFILQPSQIPAEVWSQARLLWINYPHNPTGAVASRADLSQLYRASQESGTLLCGDEAYLDVYEGDAPPSVLEVADSELKGVLSYLSLSKRSAMTGYRSGAIVGDAEAISALRSLRTSTGTAPPEFVQAGAIAAWSDDEHATERRKIFAEKRAILRAAFESIGLEVVASAAAIYLWVAVSDDIKASDRLLTENVLVSPGRTFGPGGEGYIRLALVPTIEECEEATEVLKRCLTGI